MAQIIEERITIVISRMVADTNSELAASLISEDIKNSLIEITQELVGESAIVEIIEGQ